MRARYEMVVAIIVAVLAVILAFGGIGAALGTQHPGDSRGGDIAVAVICLLLAAGCVRVAVLLEHRFRGPKYPGYGSLDNAVSVTDGYRARRATSRIAARRRQQRNTPTSLAIVTGGCLVAAAACLALMFAVVKDADLSTYVQHHGVPDTGLVTQVVNHAHSTRSGTNYTADVSVTLVTPVAGVTQTVVRYPQKANTTIGVTYPVLVDPRRPSYAEFPGSPSTSAAGWVVMLILVLLFVGFAVLNGIRLVRMLRSHQRGGSFAVGADTAPTRL